MRAIYHYIFIVFVVWVFGAWLSPFIDALPPWEWMGILLVIFGPVFLLRSFLETFLVLKVPHHSQTKRQFLMDIGLIALAGVIIKISMMIFYGLPAVGVFYAFLICLVLGYFAGADLAMEREYKLFLVLRESGENLKGSDARLPLTTKITLVASFTIIFLSAIFLFVILKDLKWLNSIPAEDLFEAKKSIFIQISAISLIFLLEVLNLIKSLTRNLKTFFTNQIEVLQAVAQGNLESRVTAATHDEFATMAEYTNHMIDKLRERTREVEITQDVTIHSLAAMAELRDPETGAHILRTQRYLRELALELKDTAGYKEVLTPENIELLYKSAPLHDIGKVGVRDAILLKPDRLTADEFEIMKKHTDYGQNILQKAEETLGTNSFLSFAKEIAISHQEKWDGSGYPEGLKGNEIPISGRLMAIADVYDALISRRVYKEPFTHEQTVEKIGEGRGTHFDPVMVDAFMRIEKKFNEIAKNFKET